MRVNEFFDGVFLINLRRRADRLIKSLQELEKHSIEAEIVEAIDGNDLEQPTAKSSDGLIPSRGDIACALSHAKVCRIAKERGLKNYLVLEDDCMFSANFTDKFPTFIKDVPNDWQFLYVGGSHNGEQARVVSDWVIEASEIYTTHAMGVHESVYDELIWLWESQTEKVDLCVAQLQKKYKTYAFSPFIVGQHPSHSDILNRYADYKHLQV